jgi:hypothetical protein
MPEGALVHFEKLEGIGVITCPQPALQRAEPGCLTASSRMSSAAPTRRSSR